MIPQMCGDQLDSRFSSWKVSRQGLQVRAGFYKAAPHLWSTRPAAVFISWTYAETAQSSGRCTPWFVRKDITKHSDEKVWRGEQSLFVGTSDVPLSRSLDPPPFWFLWRPTLTEYIVGHDT